MQNFYLSKDDVKEKIRSLGIAINDDYNKIIAKVIEEYSQFGKPFYIFSFLKSEGTTDIIGVKKIYHVGRWTKPDPLPGTQLQRVIPPNNSTIHLIWSLPDEESIKLYKQGMVFENEFVHSCVERFMKNPKSMITPELGDATDNEIREFYKTKRLRALQKKSDKVGSFMRSNYDVSRP